MEVRYSSVMNVQQVSQALSNPTRLNLLELVGAEPCSAAEAHRKYVETYDEMKRESIYRELENLVDASLLYKEYSSDAKELRYHLAHERLLIRLPDCTIDPTAET